jgi:hypothetical protein
MNVVFYGNFMLSISIKLKNYLNKNKFYNTNNTNINKNYGLFIPG